MRILKAVMYFCGENTCVYVSLLIHVNDELSRMLRANLAICSANTRGNEFVKILTGISRVREAGSSMPETNGLEKDARKVRDKVSTHFL